MISKWLRTSLLVLMIAGLAGCQILPFGNQANQAQEEILRTYEVTLGNLDITVAASGKTTVNEQRDVFFPREGEVSHINFEVNDTVRAGDILATLDRTALERQYRQSEINLEQAQINLDRLTEAGAEERDIEFAQLTYDNAAQALSLADMAIKNAEIEANEMQVQAQRAREQAHQRWREAVANGNANADRLQDTYEESLRQEDITKLSADAMIAQAKASYQSAYVRLMQAERSLELLDQEADATQVKQLEVQVALSQLALEQNQSNLDDAILTAPISGKVVAVNINERDQYRTSQPAFTIVDDNVFYIDLTVDEIDIGKVAPGQTVEVILDAYNDVILAGVVEAIDPASTNIAGIVSYPVRIQLTDTQDIDIRSGMTASVTIYTYTLEDIIIIPNWAIRTDQTTGRAYSFVVKDDLPVRTDIELGTLGDVYSQVLSGLNVGDVVGLVPEASTLPFER